MNIKLNKNDIEKTNIKTTKSFSDSVKSWMYDSTKEGMDYLMKTIKLVEPGEYNDEVTPISDKEFIMTKKNGEVINFKLTEGDIEDYPVLSVNKDKVTNNYSCNIEGNMYQILLTSIDRELTNGRVHEHTFEDVDSFQYSNGESIIYFYIPATEEKHKTYQFPYHKEFVNALNKNEFPKDIQEAFDLLYKYIKNTRIVNYSISYVNKENGYSNISVKNNAVSKYTKTIDGKTYSIDTTTQPYTLLKNDVELEPKEEVIKKLSL